MVGPEGGSQLSFASLEDWLDIVAGGGGQFLNSWNRGRQAPGSGIYRLGEDELDRREFARVGNPLARPDWGWRRGIGAGRGRFSTPAS